VRLITFFTCGNGKQVIASRFNDGQENPYDAYVHLCAAAIAGIAMGMATCVRRRRDFYKDLSANLLFRHHRGRNSVGGKGGLTRARAEHQLEFSMEMFEGSKRSKLTAMYVLSVAP
jgi:hypothetical protein